jgi:ribonuclease BN (tRNA processing enzyme)
MRLRHDSRSSRIEFSKEIEGATKMAKGPDLFLRSGRDKPNELRVMRRWNSHTPALLDVRGGGYFLHWQDRGTIIDPGASFLKLFRLLTPYGFQDINMILTTHDHMDHCQDFGTLISLLRSFNKLQKDHNKANSVWDLILSLGVATQFESHLVHPENAPQLRWRTALPPQDIEAISDLPGRSHRGNPKTIKKKYSYELRALKAFHKELLGENTAMGFRFKLGGANKEIIISGDTAFGRGNRKSDERELVREYQGAHLLILHVGTMEKKDQRRLDQHLGLTGIVGILKALSMDPPELVILTEWGYEFGRLGSFGRSRFTELVVAELESQGCHKYFAAIEGTTINGGDIPIIPADIDLRISLPELKIWSQRSPQLPVPATDIRAKEQADRIIYI